MFDFPNSPTLGQEYEPIPGTVYTWDGTVWKLISTNGGVEEAPVTGLIYGRQDANWVEVTGGGGGATDWADITGKPTTFPPTVPIAQADITNLVTDLAAKLSLSGGVMTGRIVTKASSTSASGLVLPHGDEPTTGRVDGDLWTTSAGLFVRIEGANIGPLGPGIADAPNDGNPYVRKSLGWDNFTDDMAAKADAATTTSALAGKEPTIAAGTTAQYWRGDKAWTTLDKAAVGLANVDNTSDASKPVSTATQAALDNKANTSALADYLLLSGGTLTGKLNTPPSQTTGAGINIGQGVAAPSAPVDGDVWITTSVLNWRGAGGSYSAVNVASTQSITGNKTFSGAGCVISGRLTFNASDTTRHRLNLAASSSVPAAPTDGDIWTTSTGMFARINGGTRNCSIHVGTTAPSSPATGDLWVDTT